MRIQSHKSNKIEIFRFWDSYNPNEVFNLPKIQIDPTTLTYKLH